MKIALFLGLLLGVAANATTSFTVDANVSGTPGSTVGWGFNLSNDTGFLVVTGTGMCTDSSSVAACLGSPVAEYTDFLATNTFSVVGPSPESPTLNQSYVQGVSGLGSFLIPDWATPSYSWSPTLYLTYDVYSVSPNDLAFNPDTDILSLGQTLLSTSNISVTSVPEPTTLSSVALAFVALGGWTWSKRRREGVTES
ncbi:MAG: PEP-CTERM sorting domain-containing protein [Bryobacteraceae bacterium]